jgi:DnaJ-class molecular chaperone
MRMVQNPAEKPYIGLSISGFDATEHPPRMTHMDQDLYSILQVKRGASADEIRTAYRKLAKELHPDLHPGDKAAEEKFKLLSAAFAILGDPEKRKRYDAGEIDASGQERPGHFYRDFAESRGGARYRSAEGFHDFSDMFSDLFGARGAGAGAGGFSMKGQDYRYNLEIEFLEAVKGAKKRVLLPEGEALDMNVPAGVVEGQALRLKGKGGPGVGRAPAGDALIQLKIKPHPFFERDGDDIILELPVTVDEAVLGAKVEAPTISGRVAISVPKGASSGQTLRLRGKGIQNVQTGATGDQLVKIKIVMPGRIDPELEKFMEAWREKNGYDPRAKLRETL